MNISIKTSVMHKVTIYILFSILTFMSSIAFAQNEAETALPLTDMEVVRKVALIDIEGKYYEDVTISFKSTSPDGFLTDKYKVKIKVTNNKGKSIYKKTFNNVFLYVFPSGQILVGKRNFDQVAIFKSDTTDENIGIIREKEGIY